MEPLQLHNKGEFKVSDYSENMENLGKDFEILLPPVDKKKKVIR